MIWSKYQNDIFDAVLNTSTNININASAGSAKTTTIVEAATRYSKKFPYKSILFNAFNNSIVEELKKRLPDSITCSTIHSLGMQSLIKHYKTSMKVNDYKSFVFADKVIEGMRFKRNQKDVYKYTLMEIVNLMRMTLVDVEESAIEELCNRFDITITNGEIDDSIKLLNHLNEYNESISKNQNYIDFTDMVYIPAIDENIWLKQYDIIFTDECFPGLTAIQTIDGKFTIQNLYNRFKKNKYLPLVNSFNEKKQIFEYKKIKNVWNKGNRKLISIYCAAGRKIQCTPEHKFLLSNFIWQKANQLKEGDALLSDCHQQPFHRLITNQQKEFLQASLLGDGSAGRISKNIWRFSWNHGAKQKEYLEWKNRILFEDKISFLKENGTSKKPAYCLCTKGIYIKDEEVVRSYIISKLNIKMLAIMFMDDGCMNENGASLGSTCSYKNLSYQLKDKLTEMGYECNVIEFISKSAKKSLLYNISFNKKSSDKLSSDIAIYVHNSMSYKVKNKDRHLVGTYAWSYNKNNFGCIVVNKIVDENKSKTVYDLEVEDNHNFIITSHSSGRKNDIKRLQGSNSGVVVHNCQDLNAIQQLFIEKSLKKNGRLVSVGDRKQAIYGFAGSDVQSFDYFKNRPNTISLPLTVCYRCAKSIVRNAQEVNSEIEVYEKQEEGVVRKGTVEEITKNDLVICRNTRPLVALYFQLLEQDKKSYIKGRDIENGLIALYNKVKDLDKYEAKIELTRRLEFIEDELAKKKVKKPREHVKYINFREKVRIIEIISNKVQYMFEVEKLIHELFKDRVDAIKLMTIHKSKGLENDRVFYIESFNGEKLIPSKYATQPWEIQQEENVLFVALTRAQKTLVYINFTE